MADEEAQTDFKTKKSEPEVLEVLSRYLPPAGTPLGDQVRRRFLQRLEELRSAMEQSTFFKVGSSYEVFDSLLMF